MQSVFTIITKLIAAENYFGKEVSCNNFGRDGTKPEFWKHLSACGRRKKKQNTESSLTYLWSGPPDFCRSFKGQHTIRGNKTRNSERKMAL